MSYTTNVVSNTQTQIAVLQKKRDIVLIMLLSIINSSRISVAPYGRNIGRRMVISSAMNCSQIEIHTHASIVVTVPLRAGNKRLHRLHHPRDGAWLWHTTSSLFAIARASYTSVVVCVLVSTDVIDRLGKLYDVSSERLRRSFSLYEPMG